MPLTVGPPRSPWPSKVRHPVVRAAASVVLTSGVDVACSTVAALGFQFIGIVDHGTYHPIAAYEADHQRLGTGTTQGVSPTGDPIFLIPVGNRWSDQAMAVEHTGSEAGHDDVFEIVGLGVRQRYHGKVRKDIPKCDAAVVRFFATLESPEALARTWCYTLRRVCNATRAGTLFFPVA